jgi:hypothetical protein
MVPAALTSGEHNTVVLVARIIGIWETVVHQQQMLPGMAWISFIRELLGRHRPDCRHTKEGKKTKYAVKGKRKK